MAGADRACIDLSGWVLAHMTGVSADGLTIAGRGSTPNGAEGWVLSPEHCPADFNHSGRLNSQDFFDFLTAFFGADHTADFNRNGVIDSQDVFDFLAAFFIGC